MLESSPEIWIPEWCCTEDGNRFKIYIIILYINPSNMAKVCSGKITEFQRNKKECEKMTVGFYPVASSGEKERGTCSFSSSKIDASIGVVGAYSFFFFFSSASPHILERIRIRSVSHQIS